MCKNDGHSLTREFLALRPHNSQDWLSLSLRYTYPTSCMAGYENPTPLPTWHLWLRGTCGCSVLGLLIGLWILCVSSPSSLRLPANQFTVYCPHPPWPIMSGAIGTPFSTLKTLLVH